MSARGILIDLASEQDAPVGELIGVGVAIILLTLLFRSLAAMAATLVGALLGVMVGQILLAALAKPLGLPQFAAVIAVMLGLGAGIDYALLIIGRYREQVALGDSPRDASAKAAATSGASVVAAGVIVMVAIAGLLVIGIPLIGKLGIGGGDRRRRRRRVRADGAADHDGRARKRWLRPKKPEHVRPSPRVRALGRAGHGAAVAVDRRRRARAAGLRRAGHAAAARPARRRQPARGQVPARRLRQALSKAFGPGSNGPFLLAVDIPKGAADNEAQLAKLQKAVADTPGVVNVAPPQVSEDGEMATVFAIPTTAPQDAKTSALLERLRDDVIPGATAGTPLKVYVGGQTAGFEDFSDKVAGRLPLFISVVIGLSVLLLIAAFRSLWIPLVSAVFNLLSVGAAYGVVVAVFQEGVGASLIGVDAGVPIVSFIPVMLFAILFGLSMDYNVFLLSRIHEAYNDGDGPRESVIHGHGADRQGDPVRRPDHGRRVPRLRHPGRT